MGRRATPILPWLLFGAMVWCGTGCNITTSSPGGEETVDQPEASDPSPDSPSEPIALLDRLRTAWNSEAAADWPAAELLASMSTAAYLPLDAAEPAYEQLGFTEITPLAAGSLSGYIVSADDVSVIAFCGTDNAGDWLVNLELTSVQTAQGYLHQGFLQAYKSLKPQIMKVLAEREPQHLWITGHSLGGALALVCAFDLVAYRKRSLDGLMTFGQPMVADQKLAAYLDDLLLGRYAHYVNGEDIVPRVPPRYAHCGSLVWFKDGKIRRSRPKGRVSAKLADPAFVNRSDPVGALSDEEFADLKAELDAPSANPGPTFRPTAFAKEVPLWIQDHAMALYLELIQSTLGAAQAADLSSVKLAPAED
jgi:hypothetical protein